MVVTTLAKTPSFIILVLIEAISGVGTLEFGLSSGVGLHERTPHKRLVGLSCTRNADQGNVSAE
jgi:hypothetical protein